MGIVEVISVERMSFNQQSLNHQNVRFCVLYPAGPLSLLPFSCPCGLMAQGLLCSRTSFFLGARWPALSVSLSCPA